MVKKSATEIPVLSPTPAVYQYSESRSSVEIEDMARGEPKVTVKVYKGDTPGELLETYKLAVKTYNATKARLAKPVEDS